VENHYSESLEAKGDHKSEKFKIVHKLTQNFHLTTLIEQSLL